jgi:HEAT repeat protein
MNPANSFEQPRSGDGRSAPEVMVLLLELGRLVKARRFYSPGDPRLVKLFERGLRAWQADLARHGALELSVDSEGFRSGPDTELLGARQLDELVRELVERGVSHMRLEADIDAEALAGLVEVLAADRDAVESEGGPAAALHARVPLGIALDAARPHGALSRDGSAGEERLGLEDDDAQWTLQWEQSGGSNDAAEVAHPETLAADDVAADLAGEESIWEIADGPADDLSATTGPCVGEDAAAAARGEHAESASRLAPSLGDLLQELDECGDAAAYAESARRVAPHTPPATEEDRHDEAFEILRHLSQHAAQGRKRSARQAALAQSFLGGLASGARLADLLERVCAPEHETSVRAAQVLLQLGEDAAAALVQAAELETDRTRRARMHGVLIALGEKALPELVRLLDTSAAASVRTAVRLLGNIQSPAATARLVALLEHPEASIREEAAKALVRIGDPQAISALVNALRSTLPGLSAVAVYCLAASGSPRAVRPLVELLERAWRDGRTDVAREAIRALGRLGRQEATRPLADLLFRKGLLRRRRLRELKVAAASALGCLPGDEAVGALAQAVGSRDGQIRRAAQLALERRAQTLGPGRA